MTPRKFPETAGIDPERHFPLDSGAG